MTGALKKTSTAKRTPTQGEELVKLETEMGVSQYKPWNTRDCWHLLKTKERQERILPRGF
jgi:hypothetical protein